MIKKLLQQLAIVIQLGRAFFPGILLIALVYVFFTDFVQEKTSLSLDSNHVKQDFSFWFH